MCPTFRNRIPWTSLIRACLFKKVYNSDMCVNDLQIEKGFRMILMISRTTFKSYFIKLFAKEERKKDSQKKKPLICKKKICQKKSKEKRSKIFSRNPKKKV